jgi:hypothetical protein
VVAYRTIYEAKYTVQLDKKNLSDRTPPCFLPSCDLRILLPLYHYYGLDYPFRGGVPAGRTRWWIGGTSPPFLAILNPTADEKSLVGSTMLQLSRTKREYLKDKINGFETKGYN